MHWFTIASCVLALTNAKDNSLLWGPYRPDMYFGIRPRVPQSLLSGLMYFQSNNLAGLAAIRHDCTNNDNVAKFGWTDYDPRTGGRQVIYDNDHNVNITTELVKSEDGLSWEVRIRGEQAPDSVLSTVWYTALESADPDVSKTDYLKIAPKTQQRLTPQGIKGDIDLHGYSKDLGGRFVMSISEGIGQKPTHHHEWAEVKPAEKSHYFSLQIPKNNVWRAAGVYITLIQDQVAKFLEIYSDKDTNIPAWSVFSIADDDKLGGNMHFIQKTFKGPFEFSVSFVPEESSGFPAGASFDDRLNKVLKDQNAKFENSLSIQEPYTSQQYHEFAKEMISSIAGGIGYFYGDSLIREEDGVSVEHSLPRELFSGTPSRPFFPRGFYWDEGFNALALMNFDTDLVLQIIDSWFQTMDEDGWIEREQILGDEGRSRVPEEFQVQDRSVANPPTLVMALAHLSSVNNDTALLRKIYPALKTHFDWFRRGQKGETVTFDREFPSREVYRWRGRTATHILASGLDDYPRAADLSDGELHVDLVAWVGAMALSLSHMADMLNKPEDATFYSSVIEGVKRNLEQVFWNEEAQAFCDIAVDEWEEDIHVCHIGYVTHLPFFLKLVPEHNEKQLLALLDDLSDPEQLWSVGGIRSLSKRDEFFGTEENYWRGPVWNNMNFLALDALQYYASPESSTPHVVKAKAAQVYHDLRRNVVDNIYTQWQKSGYVWESYEAQTGEPKGAKAFTGWAGLVANIMAMPDSLDVSKAAPTGDAVTEPTVELTSETQERTHDEL